MAAASRLTRTASTAQAVEDSARSASAARSAAMARRAVRNGSGLASGSLGTAGHLVSIVKLEGKARRRLGSGLLASSWARETDNRRRPALVETAMRLNRGWA